MEQVIKPVTIIHPFINKESYLKDFKNNFETVSACVTDGRLAGEKKYFKIIRNTDLLDLTSEYFSNKLQCNASARYYWIKKGRRLWWHTDSGTKCSINIVLNENKAQIEIAGHEDLAGPPPKEFETFSYEACILDTTTYHSVPNYTDKDRILFKISIFDRTYEDIASLEWDTFRILNT